MNHELEIPLTNDVATFQHCLAWRLTNLQMCGVPIAPQINSAESLRGTRAMCKSTSVTRNIPSGNLILKMAHL